MKRAILLIFLMLVLMLRIVSAACSGVSAYGPILEGESITLTAPGNVDSGNGAITWTITSPIYPNDNSDNFFKSAFSVNPTTGCDVDFSVVKNDTYTVEVTDGTNTQTLTIEVLDVFTEKGFGHQCFVINTQNCADVYTYGETIVLSSMSVKNDLFSYGLIHAYNEITVGEPVTVRLKADGVTLPNTTINGILTADGLILTSDANISSPDGPVLIDDDLQVNGQIFGGVDGILQIGSDVEIGDEFGPISPKNLTVYGSTTLYKIESLSNDGLPIVVNANLDVAGDVDVSVKICLGEDPDPTVNCRSQWVEYEEVGIENLVRNPGFEYYDHTWISQNDDTGTGFSTERAHTGQYSGKLVSKNPESYWWSDVVPISLYEDTEFTFSAWYYLESGSVDLFLLAYPSYDGSTYYPTGYSAISVPGTTVGEWTRLTETFTVTADKNYLVVRLDANGAGTTVYFDDVQLEKGGTANKVRPRFLDFRGNAEFGDLDVMGELYTEGFLTAMSGAAVIGDLSVAGMADVSGNLDVTGDVDVSGIVDVSGYLKASDADVAGNVIVTQETGRLQGPINLRKTCDAASPRMYQDGGDFVIELGVEGTCTGMQPCETSSDCVSNSCRTATKTCKGFLGDPCVDDADCVGSVVCNGCCGCGL